MQNADERCRVIGRLAPSPTGYLHAGNIFSFLMSWLVAKSQGGEIVLRIEDLDPVRSRRVYIDAIEHDLDALGLSWDKGPYFQHDRDEAYAAAFAQLADKGLVYPCFCTRADISALSAPHTGEKRVYPGTCRNLTDAQRAAKRAEIAAADADVCRREPAMRVMVDARTVTFDDAFQGSYRQKLDEECGDFIVRRADGAFAYQLAVVVDDADQNITSVVRGIDLISSTPQQIYLQDLLGYDHPRYAHHPLFVAPDGRRLAKRNHDASIDALLETYKTYEGVIGHIAYIGELVEDDEPASPEKLLETFDMKRAEERFRDKIAIAYPCALL